MRLDDDQIREIKHSKLFLEGILKLLQRLYYEGLIIIFLLIAFGCSLEYLMIRMLK